MSSPKPLDLGLKTAYDELFMDDKGRAENRLPRIYDIPLSEIDDFPDHPYQVRMDEDKQTQRLMYHNHQKNAQDKQNSRGNRRSTVAATKITKFGYILVDSNLIW